MTKFLNLTGLTNGMNPSIIKNNATAINTSCHITLLESLKDPNFYWNLNYLGSGKIHYLDQ